MKSTLRLVDSIEGFESLQQDWDALYKQSEHSTIFSSWDWLYTWWEVFKDQFNRKLYIICLYLEDELVGIAPFQITKSFPKLMIQGKTLQFIGNGEACKDRIVSESQDFIVLHGMESKMIDSVSKYLTEHKNQWDFADFEFLVKDALILKCFEKAKSRISRCEIEYGVRFYIPKMESVEQYHSLMGKRWSKMFAKKSRIISRDGEVITESTETLESIEPALTQLADMHCSRWREKTGRCIFDSSRFSDFHYKIMKRLVPKNKVSIKTLYLNNEALASYYTFIDKNQIHYYQSGFHTKYANRYSPLFLLVINEIGASIENNQVFDFMFADDAGSYKKEQYACDYESMYRLRWTPKKYRFLLFNCVKYGQEKALELKEKQNNLFNKKQKK